MTKRKHRDLVVEDQHPLRPLIIPPEDMAGEHQILFSEHPLEDMVERFKDQLFDSGPGSRDVFMGAAHWLLLGRMDAEREERLACGELKNDGVTVPEAEWELWADPQNWGELGLYGELFDALVDAIMLKYITMRNQFNNEFWRGVPPRQ